MSEEHQNIAPVEEEGYNRDEINAGLIGGLTVVTVVFIVAAIFFLQYYYDRNYEQQVFVKVLEPVSADLKDLRAREDQQLGAYSYIDRDKGTVNLPISRAMELLASEYEAGQLRYPTTPYPVTTEEELASGTTATQ